MNKLLKFETTNPFTTTIYISLFFCLIFIGINAKAQVKISIINETNMERTGEIVSLDLKVLQNKFSVGNTAQFMVKNARGQEIPSQKTYDRKLIFQANVAAKSRVLYTVIISKPVAFDTLACGSYHPERVDDIAWESDKMAYRLYGPKLQASRERGFGYDIWVKNTSKPIVNERYNLCIGKRTQERLAELRKTDKKAMRELEERTSYHNDHGNGMDCYEVGPTLGAGCTAIIHADSLIYPYCYQTYEILDNGPLRFTVHLTYQNTTIGGEQVMEERIITLDAGSYLNHVILSYKGLTKPTDICTGIVLHEANNHLYTIDKRNHLITYIDPTEKKDHDKSGYIYVGTFFPTGWNKSGLRPFNATEIKSAGNKAFGHVMAYNTYRPKSTFSYYFGAAWSKGDIKDINSWKEYLNKFSMCKYSPLRVFIREKRSL